MKSLIREIVERLAEIRRTRFEEIISVLNSGDPRAIRRLLLDLSAEASKGLSVKVYVNLSSLARSSDAELKDLAVIYDVSRKRFRQNEKEKVIEKAKELFGEVTITPFMSRERDGIHIRFGTERVDVMSSGVFVWARCTEKVLSFLEFLEKEAYLKV